jgi:hypothetical protein
MLIDNISKPSYIFLAEDAWFPLSTLLIKMIMAYMSSLLVLSRAANVEEEVITLVGLLRQLYLILLTFKLTYIIVVFVYLVQLSRVRN